MKPVNLKNQGGVALIMFVLMLMGVGGILFVGYSQGLLKQVELSKFEHNTRVLNEAKQALLMYAYRYPTTALVFNGTSRGPGRLPCPDTNNSGTPNSSSFCINIDALVGRFPWNANGMEFYDAKGAEGESLWYAVSRNFANTGPPKINSDTDGTITLVDQSGKIIYDGNGAGIAAIIIAPGPEMAGQNRIGGPNDPANFLDSFNGFDNAVFNNGESDTNDDGFILGPVFDQGQNIIVINDQMIVITAAEVIEMAEKATLQAYRKSINDYLALTGGVYPWLYNYITACFGETPSGSGITEAICISNSGVWRGPIGIGDLTTLYPAHADFNDEITYELDNFGRIPSIFNTYFSDTDSQPIESKLNGSLSMTYPITPTPVASSSSGIFYFNDGAQTFNFQTANKLTNVKFVDLGGGNARLTGTVIAPPQSFTDVIYFWDYEDDPTGIWTMCPGLNQLSDCDVDDDDYEILRVFLTLNFNIGAVNFDYTSAPGVAPVVAASSSSHASITAIFNGADVISSSLPLSAFYQIDDDWDEGDSFDVEESGTMDLTNLVLSQLTLGMRYYPVLPDWAFDNGWHDSIMMAYAQDYRPDTPVVPCTEGTDCIQINNLAGNNDNKISILTIAGQHDWVDDGAPGFSDDVGDVFDVENADILDIDGTEYLFDRLEPGGNDKILVIEEI